MTDNNTPQYSKPMEEDLPSQEELFENPYYGDGSAPVAQNFSGNNQPQYQNPVNNPVQYYNPNNNQPQYYNPPQAGAQQIKQAYPDQAPYYTPPLDYNNNIYYNNGINYNNQPQIGRPKRGRLLANKKFLMFLAIILIIVPFIDTGLQIGFNFFSPFLLVDGLAILTIAFILIFFIVKGKLVNRRWLGALTVFVWFVGFGVRGFGMTQFESGIMVAIEFFVTAIRTFALFFCIPFTCN